MIRAGHLDIPEYSRILEDLLWAQNALLNFARLRDEVVASRDIDSGREGPVLLMELTSNGFDGCSTGVGVGKNA